MPRPTRPLAAVAPEQGPHRNSLVASAADLTNSKLRRPTRIGSDDWQNEAWYFYDTVGEFRFAVAWKAQAVSRATLTITEDTPAGEVTVTTGPEVDALAALHGGGAGHAQMLNTLTLHLEVPGESYLIGEPVGSDLAPEDRWGVYSNDEVTYRAGAWTLDRGDGQPRTLPEDAVVIRLWHSHPRKWVEADSPARAVLPVLREIEGLTKHVAATVDSRLAGAGVFMVPSEMTFAGSTPDENTDPDYDPFIAKLTKAMTTAIGDRDSAAALVPVVVRAPGALIKAAQHFTFATPLDEKALDLRAEGIRRLALGLDQPPEVLLGLSDSNHWSAWQIDEAALKTHIEPTCEMITSALTERWLRPAVEAMGAQVNPARRINYDVSVLRLRPDRSAEAQAAYDRLELSGEALRRETGFDQGDEPKPDEVAARLLRRVASGVVAPDTTVAALNRLGVNLPAPAGQPAGDPDLRAPKEPGDVEDPTPAPDARRELPEAPDLAAAVTAAAELLISRAVERANNRVHHRGKTPRPIPADRLDAALMDAWDAAPRTAALLRIDPDTFTEALNTYTRALLTEGVPHSPGILTEVLTTRGCLPALTGNRHD